MRRLIWVLLFFTAAGIYAQQNPSPDNMVLINGGTFTMGSPAEEPERMANEGPQRKVTLSGFYMCKYQVTQAEYQQIIGITPSGFKGDDLPVENVSWYDAIEYCNKRSEKEGLTPVYTIDKTQADPTNTNRLDNINWKITFNRRANGYRLPTEAEWEYACRAGTTTPFSTGNNITTDQANYDGNFPYNNNDKGAYHKRTMPVGSFAPNPWGLYDMHGNVWEWCWDWYGSYTNVPQTDPVGAATGTSRVMRGGGWSNSAGRVRSARRSGDYPYYGYILLGFRLVRNAK
jgi:formylglycine-generating enzyme required for sulfatase activity